MSGSMEDCSKKLNQQECKDFDFNIKQKDYEDLMLEDYFFEELEEEYAFELVNDHWKYIKSLLVEHGEPDKLIKLIGFHYKTSGVHFFKHGREYEQEKQKLS